MHGYFKYTVKKVEAIISSLSAVLYIPASSTLQSADLNRVRFGRPVRRTGQKPILGSVFVYEDSSAGFYMYLTQHNITQPAAPPAKPSL